MRIIIVEKAPETSHSHVEAKMLRPVNVLTLAAKTEGALKDPAKRYADYLTAYPEYLLSDACFLRPTREGLFFRIVWSWRQDLSMNCARV